MTSPYEVRPIGYVESPLGRPQDRTQQGDEGAPEAWLVFDPDVAQAIRDLAGSRRRDAHRGREAGTGWRKMTRPAGWLTCPGREAAHAPYSTMFSTTVMAVIRTHGDVAALLARRARCASIGRSGPGIVRVSFRQRAICDSETKPG